MNDIRLFESDHSDLFITNRFLQFSGERLNISEIKEVDSKIIKPNYSTVLSIGFIGSLVTVLGKLRSGFSIQELLDFEVLAQFYNVWDATGVTILIVAMLMFLSLKEKYIIHLTMKNGKMVHYVLNQKNDQTAFDKIDKALKQAIRYNRFINDSEIIVEEESSDK